MHRAAQDDNAVEARGRARQRIAAVRKDRRQRGAVGFRSLTHDASRRHRAALHDEQPRRLGCGGRLKRKSAACGASYNHPRFLQGPDPEMGPVDP
jgi:hypothetical protein